MCDNRVVNDFLETLEKPIATPRTNSVSIEDKSQYNTKEVRGWSLPISRARIIEDISGNGLNTPLRLRGTKEEFFPSNDEVKGYLEDFPDYPDHVSGNLVNPRKIGSGLKIGSNLWNKLYASAVGVMAVICERNDPNDFLNVPRSYLSPVTQQQKDLLERRMAASFMVVCDENVEHKVGPIPSSDFLYILIPKPICDEYRNVRPNALSSNKVVIVESVIKRQVDVRPITLMVPNYEGVLRRLLSERGKPLWVHGVRLPTEEDLARLQAK